MRTAFLANRLEVGVVGLGCMPMSHAYTPMDRDDAESIRVIRRAIELGITLFDTADIYGPFSNEKLLGRALRRRRERATIATKCGLVPGPGIQLSRNGRPEHLRKACEDSLARLQTDYIDLYQLHRVDPEVPLEESWGALAELVRAGKVQALGISHATINELSRAHAVHPIACVQHELSIWAQHACTDVLPWCQHNNVGFLAFFPIGRGYLSGAMGTTRFDNCDARSRDPRFTPLAMRANQRIIEGMRSAAARHDATLAQVAIAWVLSQGEQVVPIPGTKRRRWLEENAGAADLKLSTEDLDELAALPPPVGGDLI
jgi:aryl-alcohol dehydrogenase-like predicted oxidoreductase